MPLPWPTFDTARAAALREMREDVSMSKHSTHATRTLKTSPLRRGLELSYEDFLSNPVRAGR